MNSYAPPLQGTADNLAQYGRYGDSMLVHMNPIEVQGIAALSPTGRLTTNPVTGQQEAFLPFLAPLLGSWLGLGAGGSALLSGALTWAKTGDLGKGILGGLTSFGMGKILDAIPSSVDVDVPGVLPDATGVTDVVTDAATTGLTDAQTSGLLSGTLTPGETLLSGDSTLGSNVFQKYGTGSLTDAATSAIEPQDLWGRGLTRDGRIDWSRAGELDFSKDVAGNLILSSAAGAELGRLDALEDLEKTQAGLDAERKASSAQSEEDYERAMLQSIYDYGWPERGIKPRDPRYAPTGYGAIPMVAAGGGLISLNPSDYSNKREGLARLMGEPVRMDGGGMINDGDFYRKPDPYYGNPSFLDTPSMSAAQAQGALRGPQVISAEQMRQLAAAGHRPGIDPEIQFFRQPEEFPSFLDPLNPGNVPPPPSPDDEAPPDIILDPVTTDPVTTLPNLGGIGRAGGIGRGFNFGNLDYPDDEGDRNWWENLDDRNVVEGEVSPPAITPPPGTFRIPDAVAPPIASRPAQLAVPPVPALTVAPPVVPPMRGRARRYADLIKRNAPPAPQPPVMRPLPPGKPAPIFVPPNKQIGAPTPPVMQPPAMPFMPPPAMPPPMPPPQVAPPMAARPPVVPRIPSPSPVVAAPPPLVPPSVADWSEYGGWSGLPSIAADQKAAPKAKAKKKTKKKAKKESKKGSSGRGRKHEGGLIKMQDMGQVPEAPEDSLTLDTVLFEDDKEKRTTVRSVLESSRPEEVFAYMETGNKEWLRSGVEDWRNEGRPDWGTYAYLTGDMPDDVAMARLQRLNSIINSGYKMVDKTKKAEGGLVKMQDMGQVPEMESGIASVDPAMGDMDAEAMQLVELTAMAVLGQIPAEQADPIIQAFIQQFGPEAFQMLRQQVLASVEPGAQTEGMIQGQGDGMSDEIMGSIGDQQRVAVSPGEYIVPADVVSGIGNGSSDAGAGELDRMMSDIRQARTGMTEQPPEINPRTAMPV